MFQESIKFVEFRRLSSFARHQSLCLIVTNYRIRRSVVWKKFRAENDIWRIFFCQKQFKHSIFDKIDFSQNVVNKCKRVDCFASSSHWIWTTRSQRFSRTIEKFQRTFKFDWERKNDYENLNSWQSFLEKSSSNWKCRILIDFTW